MSERGRATGAPINIIGATSQELILTVNYPRGQSTLYTYLRNIVRAAEERIAFDAALFGWRISSQISRSEPTTVLYNQWSLTPLSKSVCHLTFVYASPF